MTTPTQTNARTQLADHCKVWAQILPGLEALYALSDTQDWSVESVRKMLDDKTALLVTDVDDPTGFAVVHVNESPYHDGELELFIDLVWHQGGKALDRFQSHMEMIARAAGAKHLRFYSPRPGMVRSASRVGYQVRSVEYVMGVCNGRR